MSTSGRKGNARPAASSAKPSEFNAAAVTAGLEPSQGKGAVKGQYQSAITGGKLFKFTGSVDIDAACTGAEPESPRWDYGLGVKGSNVKEFAIWVEPHPASSSSEVAKVLAKLDWLECKLEEPKFKDLKALTQLAAQAGVLRFHWLAMTGGVRIRPGSREAAMLFKRGLRLPVRHLALS